MSRTHLSISEHFPTIISQSLAFFFLNKFFLIKLSLQMFDSILHTGLLFFSWGSSNCGFQNFVFIINVILLFKMFHANLWIINFYLELIIHLKDHIVVPFHRVKGILLVFIFFSFSLVPCKVFLVIFNLTFQGAFMTDLITCF